MDLRCSKPAQVLLKGRSVLNSDFKTLNSQCLGRVTELSKTRI